MKPEKRKEPQGFVESDYGTAERFRKKAKAPEESEEAPPSVPQEDPEGGCARRERDAAQASALGAADAALNRARNRVVGAEPAAAAPAPAPAPAGRGRGATTPAWMSQAPAPAANAYGDWQSARDATSGKVSLLQRKNAADVVGPGRPPPRPRRRPNNNERGRVDPLAAGARRRRPPTAWRCGTRRSASLARCCRRRAATATGGREVHGIGGGLEGRDQGHSVRFALERGGKGRGGGGGPDA